MKLSILGSLCVLGTSVAGNAFGATFLCAAFCLPNPYVLGAYSHATYLRIATGPTEEVALSKLQTKCAAITVRGEGEWPLNRLEVVVTHDNSRPPQEIALFASTEGAELAATDCEQTAE